MLSKADNEFLTRSGQGTPMGELLRRFWMPALLSRGAARARRAAEEDQDPGRGPARLPRHQRPGRHRRAALPASRRQPLLRPQRGVRHALRLPRLEVRRRRQLRRPADLAAGVRPTRTRSSCSPIRRANGATSSGSTWARATRCRSCRSSSSAWCRRRSRYVTKKWQDCNWVQSVEGALDTAHFSFLHAVLAKDEAKARAALAKAAIADQSTPDDRIRWIHNDPRPKFTVHRPRCRPADRRRAQDRRRPISTGASRSS